MKNLEAIRSTGQESLNHLLDLGKQQSPEVKTWGVTATAAVAGGLVLAAGAQGLLAILATLAAPPVSLTVGAIGGGVLGWLYISRAKEADKATVDAMPSEEAAMGSTTPEAAPVETAPVAPVGTEAADLEAPVGDSASQAAAEAQDASVAPTLVATPSAEPAGETPAPVAFADEVAATRVAADEAAGENLGAERAVEPITITPETNLASEAAKLATPEAAPTETESPIQQDNLEEISGIGPVFAKRLHTVGIYTFAQLAALSPEQLHEMLASTRGGQRINAADWIEQASRLATSSGQ